MTARSEVIEEIADLQADLEREQVEYANAGCEEPVDPVRALEYERALRRDIDGMLARLMELRSLPCEGCGGDLDTDGYCGVCGKVAA